MVLGLAGKHDTEHIAGGAHEAAAFLYHIVVLGVGHYGTIGVTIGIDDIGDGI